MTIDEKYKKTLEEIETLKDHLGLLLVVCFHCYQLLCGDELQTRFLHFELSLARSVAVLIYVLYAIMSSLILLIR